MYCRAHQEWGVAPANRLSAARWTDDEIAAKAINKAEFSDVSDTKQSGPAPVWDRDFC
jgi:hypothetical protein